MCQACKINLALSLNSCHLFNHSEWFLFTLQLWRRKNVLMLWHGNLVLIALLFYGGQSWTFSLLEYSVLQDTVEKLNSQLGLNTIAMENLISTLKVARTVKKYVYWDSKINFVLMNLRNLYSTNTNWDLSSWTYNDFEMFS